MDSAMNYLNNGLAVVVLIAIGVGAWKLAHVAGGAISNGCRKTFDELILPLKDSAINHLKRTDQTLTSVQETNQEVCQNLRDIRSMVGEIHERVCSEN
ncbi:hypothetical protein VN12_06425 [Pirellula sp. SH-Sr6A]|uniref:hypothetical protein n=1 Tax=Pirellula sp. SH-Sr6A TaxID=1632865 RepID=UPI00078DAD11|nr:hypothetical protein [Pirellula sp. SH-Sr6A]AMV31738.1 hypothetical protein VN12_06425 [Pirellula sp. SH-Sr6A]